MRSMAGHSERLLKPREHLAGDHLIYLNNVSRSIVTSKRQTNLLLDGVSFSLNSGDRIAVFAESRDEADALLYCASGVVPVQSGNVTIRANVSWPLGQPAALVGTLSARQNAAFIQRIYGSKSTRHNELELISNLCDFEGDYFEQPLRTFNGSMKERFKLALSLAFNFDVYVVPKLSAWTFRSHTSRSKRFREAFERVTLNKTLLVSHPDTSFQDQYCNSGLVLIHGKVKFVGSLKDCRQYLKYNRKSAQRNNQLVA